MTNQHSQLGRIGAWIVCFMMLSGCPAASERREGPTSTKESTTPDEPPPFSPLMFELPLEGFPQSMIAADLDGSGRIDLAVLVCEMGRYDNNRTPWSDCSVVVYLAEANGQFVAPSRPTGVGARSYHDLISADFDADAKLDLAAIAGPNPLALATFHNRGDGTYQASQEVPLGYLPPAMIAGNFGGDPADELLLLDPGSNSFLFRAEGAGTISPLEGVSAQDGLVLLAGDFDADGLSDIVTNTEACNGVFGAVYSANGDYTFSPGATLPPVGHGSVVADINGDTYNDIVWVAHTPNQAGTLLGNGDGSFAPAIVDPWLSVHVAPHVGDLDGNGTVDAIYTYLRPVYPGGIRKYEPSVRILLGDGQGHFNDRGFVATPHRIGAVADFDGDDHADVVLVDGWRLLFVRGTDFVDAAWKK